MSDINKTIKGEIDIFKMMLASGPVIIQKCDGKWKTLLVKHGDKPQNELKWKFCGGKIIKGETLEETAIRKPQTEIGVTPRLIKPLKPMIVWQETPETGSEKPDAIVLIHYLAEIDDEPTAGNDILAMDWFDIFNLPADCALNVAPVIDEYIKSENLSKE